MYLGLIPVGATQAIEMIKLAPVSLQLVGSQRSYADGIDTSWIWDTDLEQIIQMNIQRSTFERHSRVLSDFGSLAIHAEKDHRNG